LKEGDANTSFFHKQASFRKRKNFISKIVDGDRIVTAQEEKQQVFFDYFNGLLGTAMPRIATFELPAFHRPGLDFPSLICHSLKRKSGQQLSHFLLIEHQGRMATLANSTSPAGQ
jgi:hypothetical protein